MLDGNSDLVGERGQPPDVLLGKYAGGLPDEDDRAENPAVAEHGHREDGPVVRSGEDLPERIAGVSENVGICTGRPVAALRPAAPFPSVI